MIELSTSYASLVSADLPVTTQSVMWHNINVDTGDTPQDENIGDAPPPVMIQDTNQVFSHHSFSIFLNLLIDLGLVNPTIKAFGLSPSFSVFGDFLLLPGLLENLNTPIQFQPPRTFANLLDDEMIPLPPIIDDPPVKLPNLFTENNDDINMNDVNLLLFSNIYDALSGNDIVVLPNLGTIGYDFSQVFTGGDGRDTLIVNYDQNFVGGQYLLDGGNGRDTFILSAFAGSNGGNIVIDAGQGRDTILFSPFAGQNGSVTVNGGGSNDTISMGIGAGADAGVVTVNGGGGADMITLLSRAAEDNGILIINGNNGADSITIGNFAGNNSGSLTVSGNGGSDTITFGALAGNNGGSLTVSGNGGADAITFGVLAGNNGGSLTVSGNGGADVITFGALAGINGGAVTVNGGNGADAITFGILTGINGGSVTVNGGNGADVINFGDLLDLSSSFIDGGGGFNTLSLASNTGMDLGVNIVNIDKLQLTQLGFFSLTTIDASDITDMGSNQLILDQTSGTPFSSLTLDASWMFIAVEDPSSGGTVGETYNHYQNGAVDLYVDTDVNII